MMILLVDSTPHLLDPEARPPSLALRQLGAALDAGGVGVGFVAWHQVDTRPEEVVVRGPVLTRQNGAFRVHRTTVDPRALLCQPVSHLGRLPFSTRERDAIGRLEIEGMASSRDPPTRLSCTVRTLALAGRKGVATNAPGVLARWGRKDWLESALREAQRAGAPSVPRPETHVVPGRQLALTVGCLHHREPWWIVKPANGTRGEGIRILRRGARPPREAMRGTWVVQALVQDPLRVDGHKADVRAFVCVEYGERERVTLLRPVLVRVAAAPYERGREAAEVTNTAFRRRVGLPPRILPLEDVIGDAATRRDLRRHLAALVTDLGAAVRRRMPHGVSGVHVLVWGLDVGVRRRGGRFELQLLEINVYPRFFRGLVRADEAVARMWADEVLPKLERDGTGP